MVIEDEIVRFKMQLLRKMPFYGDIVMRLPIVRNDAVPTAQTNGRMIEYNAKFLSGMREGQRNFVIMHEIFHVLLFHCDRRNERRPRIWNTAADIIVNHMLQRLTHEMNSRGIVFERPVDGIFEYINDSETVENLYAKLLEANKDQRENSKKVRVMLNNWGPNRNKQFNAPDDIILIDVTEHSGDVKKGKDDEDSKDLLKEIGLSKQAILDIIRESATKNRSSMGSYFVPKQLFGLVESKKLKWQVLLKDFLVLLFHGFRFSRYLIQIVESLLVLLFCLLYCLLFNYSHGFCLQLFNTATCQTFVTSHKWFMNRFTAFPINRFVQGNHSCLCHKLLSINSNPFNIRNPYDM